MKRSLTCFCLLGMLAALASGQQPERLAYSTAAKPVRKIVEDLKAKGVAISSVDPLVAEDIVYLRASEMATDDLLAAIAKVTYSKWLKKDDGTLRLVSNNDELKQIARRKEAARIADISKGLDELRKELAEMDNPKPADDATTDPKAAVRKARDFFGGGEGPEAKLLMRMLTMATPAQLAKLEKGQRIVYSTSPTRMQLPLTISSQAINEFLVGYNKAAAEEANRKPDDEMGGENAEQMKAMRGMMELFQPNVNREALTGMPAKVLLVISSGGSGGFAAMFGGGGDGVSANLYVFNAKGAVIGQAERSLGETGMFGAIVTAAIERQSAESEAEQKAKEAKLIPSKDAPIEFSKTSQEIDKLMRFDNPMEAFSAVVSDETMTKFSRPDEYDPLSFSLSDSLDSVAKSNGWNIAANLSDSSQDVLSMIQNGGKASGTRQFFNQMQTNEDVFVEVKDGWLKSGPKDPESWRATRMDRVSLAKLITACRTKTVPSLDDLADFAAKNEPPTMGATSATYFMYFATNAMQFFMDGFQSWDMLKLYGTLTMTQRDGLKRGEAIPFAQMTGPSAKQLNKMVYGAPPRLRVASQEKQLEGLGIMGEFMGMMPMPMRDFRTEPTEVAPNGLPSAGYLESKALTETFVQVMGEGEASKRALMSTGAREVALFRFMAQADGGFGQMMPKFDRFRPGERLTLQLKIRVSPDAFVGATLTDDKIDGTSKAVAFDQLPAGFQKLVAQRMEQYKKTGMGFGMPGRQQNAP